jgi:hypothetical protein
MRHIGEAPVCADPVELRVPHLHLACPACGRRRERPDQVHYLVSRPLADSVPRGCPATSALHAPPVGTESTEDASGDRLPCIGASAGTSRLGRGDALFDVIARSGREIIASATSSAGRRRWQMHADLPEGIDHKDTIAPSHALPMAIAMTPTSSSRSSPPSPELGDALFWTPMDAFL